VDSEYKLFLRNIKLEKMSNEDIKKLKKELTLIQQKRMRAKQKCFNYAKKSKKENVD
jgi:hypothetical protein